MRRSLLVTGLVAVLLAGCTGSHAKPHRRSLAAPTPAPTVFVGVDPSAPKVGVFRGRSAPHCPRNDAPPRSRPAQPWDVNGDGRGDVLVSYNPDEQATSFPVLHVLLTSARGTASCDEPVVGRLYRFGMSASGDFNGDGYADVAAPYELSEADGVMIFPGGPTGLRTKHPVKVHLPAGDNPILYGACLAVADFDNDGFDDLAIGSPRADGGAVEVVWGGRHGLLGGQHRIRPGRYRITSALHRFGYTIAAGDVTGDGYPDLLESADRDRYSGVGKPRLTLLRGTSRGPRHPRVLGPGYGKLDVGDLTGDGIDDIAASGPRRHGRILLYLGARGRPSPPVLIAPGLHGLPGHRDVDERFGSVAVVPGPRGRPGMLVARSEYETIPHFPSEKLWLIPGSARGINASAARIVTSATPGVPGTDRNFTGLGSTALVRNVVGALRPELIMDASRSDHRDLYVVLRLVAGRLRVSVYVVLPRHLEAEGLPTRIGAKASS